MALRTLRRSPGFALVAVVTLALGIGANTAIFSVVDAVLVRPLPFSEPERLVSVSELTPGAKREEFAVAPATFLDWRAGVRSFSSVAAWQTRWLNLTGSGEPSRLRAAAVSASLFSTLGVSPALGRGFGPESEQPGNDAVVVLGNGLWRERFGGDPRVVGTTVSMDGRPYVVAGVMPPEFRFPEEAEMWVPLAFSAEQATSHGAHMLSVVGRLAPGATLDGARAEVQGVARRLAVESPETNQGWSADAVSLDQALVGRVRPALLVLLGSVGMILLIACANVGNLLLARAAARGREMSVRAALGAGRGRLVRQLLVESLVLALLGGAAGVGVAAWGVRLVVAAAAGSVPRAAEVTVDGRVLLFTFAVAALAGVLFGLAPALHTARGDLHAGLKEGGRGGSSGVRARRVRAGLVVAEVALSMVLLAGAGLLLRSFARLVSTDPGFRTEQVLTASLNLPRGRYADSIAQLAFLRAARERIGAIPGVRQVAAVTTLPLWGPAMGVGIAIEGRPVARPEDLPSGGFDAVTPGYFEAMGIRLVRGRALAETDREGTPPVAVLSESLARRLFPGEDPIGKRIVPTDAQRTTREVVGVVADVRHGSMGADPEPRLYVSMYQTPGPRIFFAVRTAGDPAAVAVALRREVLSVDPSQPAETRTMEEVVSRSVAGPRFGTMLLGGFAGVGLLLAAIGLYGVVSYSVATRTREIGIRMALGAGPRQVLAGVLRHGMGMAGLGLVLGLAAALAAARLLGSMLYGVSAADPAVFAVVPVLLAAVALLASWLPGLRATRVDPAVAFREG
jgi:putative ABC transport system permease protein